MVRRGLKESIYDLLDENTGYLSAWVRASAKDEDKDRINAGYETVVRDQAQVLAKVLREGNAAGPRRHPECALGFSYPPLRLARAQVRHRIHRPARGADQVR